MDAPLLTRSSSSPAKLSSLAASDQLLAEDHRFGEYVHSLKRDTDQLTLLWVQEDQESCSFKVCIGTEEDILIWPTGIKSPRTSRATCWCTLS